MYVRVSQVGQSIHTTLTITHSALQNRPLPPPLTASTEFGSTSHDQVELQALPVG